MGRLLRSIRDFLAQRATRRAGRRYVPNDIQRKARDIGGATGYLYSRGWDHVAKAGPSYARSFERPRIPPSLHVSERDRIRAGEVIPLAERCIEDAGDPDAPRPGPWSTAELAPTNRRRRPRRD